MAGAKAQKRKSVDTQSPGKKLKLENGTAEGKSPKKPFVKKENGSPQKPGSQKFNKKNKGGDGPKPFAGTKQLNDKPKVKKEKGVKKENNAEGQIKKKRSPQFHKLKDAVIKTKGESNPDVIKTLEEKIKAIEARDELTKTAKRKLGLLKKLKATAEGKVLEPKKPQEKQTGTAKARRDRKKKAATEAKVAGKAKPGKQVKKEKDSDEDEDDEENGADAESSDEESGDEEAEGEEEGSDDDEEAGEEVEGEGDDSDDDAEDDDDDDAENDDDEDDESDEEPAAPKEKQAAVQKVNKEADKRKNKEGNDQQNTKVKKPKTQEKTPKPNPVNVENLKKKEIIGKNQKRYVLFIGNLPYDTTKADLSAHFSKVGEILHIRLPTDQQTKKPRGFGYIEVKDEEAYQRCLSMHHSQIQGRRINVLYTQGGNKNSENQKKEIKAKNMKLHAMRRQGQLAGSTKQSNKRTFRRNKAKNQAKTNE